MNETNTTTQRDLSPTTPEEIEAMRAMGWTHYGIFKDDPKALKLFDEVEEERNRHWCGMGGDSTGFRSGQVRF